MKFCCKLVDSQLIGFCLKCIRTFAGLYWLTFSLRASISIFYPLSLPQNILTLVTWMHSENLKFFVAVQMYYKRTLTDHLILTSPHYVLESYATQAIFRFNIFIYYQRRQNLRCVITALLRFKILNFTPWEVSEIKYKRNRNISYPVSA